MDFFDLDPSVLGNVQLPDIHVPAQDLTLWIDPLDATKEFTEKLFKYVSVMICVADKKGEAIAGVVYFPFSKRLYWSWRGHGVSENLASIKAVSYLINVNSSFSHLFNHLRISMITYKIQLR